MWRLFCPYLFLISASFGVLGGLRFVVVAFSVFFFSLIFLKYLARIQFLWLPVCLPAHSLPSEKRSTPKEMIMLPREAKSFGVDSLKTGVKTILTVATPKSFYIPYNFRQYWANNIFKQTKLLRRSTHVTDYDRSINRSWRRAFMFMTVYSWECMASKFSVLRLRLSFYFYFVCMSRAVELSNFISCPRITKWSKFIFLTRINLPENWYFSYFSKKTSVVGTY